MLITYILGQERTVNIYHLMVGLLPYVFAVNHPLKSFAEFLIDQEDKDEFDDEPQPTTTKFMWQLTGGKIVSFSSTNFSSTNISDNNNETNFPFVSVHLPCLEGNLPVNYHFVGMQSYLVERKLQDPAFDEEFTSQTLLLEVVMKIFNNYQVECEQMIALRAFVEGQFEHVTYRFVQAQFYLYLLGYSFPLSLQIIFFEHGYPELTKALLIICLLSQLLFLFSEFA